MEKSTDDILMKSRSASAAVRAGFRLYVGNFKRIFRYSWVAALVFAVVTGWLQAFLTTEMPRLMVATAGSAAIDSMPPSVVSVGITLFVGAVLAYAATLLLSSYAFALFRQHQATGAIPYPARLVSFDGHTLWRTTRCYLWLTLLGIFIYGLEFIVTSVAVTYLAPMAATILHFGLVALLLLLLLPLNFVVMKYVLTDGVAFWPTFGYGYAKGFKHFGYTLVVFLVVLLVALLVNTVISLPAVILMAANTQAQMGVINGDPLGMPDYMGVMTVVVFIIASFIQAYLMILVLCPFYYMYGSIEKQEEERQEAISKMLAQ